MALRDNQAVAGCNGVAIANNKGVAILRNNARMLGNLGNVTEGAITKRAVVFLTHILAPIKNGANEKTGGRSPPIDLCAAENAKTIKNNVKPAYSIIARVS